MRLVTPHAHAHLLQVTEGKEGIMALHISDNGGNPLTIETAQGTCRLDEFICSA